VLLELRQYRTKPGQRENWVRYMHDEIVPFQTERGMKILGTYVAEEEDDLFIWIREFESEQDRLRLYKEVYESDEWKNRIAPPIPNMLDRERMKIVRMIPTTETAEARPRV